MNEIHEMLRAMAWERAKGELRPMLTTFYGEQKRFEQLDEAITKFIDDIENRGLQE